MKTSFDRVFTDAALQATFERDGFVVMDLLNPDEIATLKELLEGLDDEVKARPFSATIMSPNLSYRRSVSQGVVGVLAERLRTILNDYRSCHGVFVAKRPGMEEGHVLLHQDQTFVDEGRFTPAVAWVPLSDVNQETGCLRAVRGSHRINHGPRGTYRDFPYPELRAVIAERFLTDLPMRAGQVCIAAATLFHESGAHHGEDVRVAACVLSIPKRSHLLYYYQHSPERMELFEVPDDFYLRHTFGFRPEGMESAGFVEARAEAVTLQQFEAVCVPAPLCS